MNTTLTVSVADKTATASGVMTIREMVSLIITGSPTSDPSGLLLRILDPAGFALMAECASFALSGGNFLGTLDLSDPVLADEFLGDDARKERAFILQLWAGLDKNLLVGDRIMLMNNPLSVAVQAQQLVEA
jgi:hypothetical protein